MTKRRGWEEEQGRRSGQGRKEHEGKGGKEGEGAEEATLKVGASTQAEDGGKDCKCKGGRRGVESLEEELRRILQDGQEVEDQEWLEGERHK